MDGCYLEVNMIGGKLRDIVLGMGVEGYFDENCKILGDKIERVW